MNLVRHLSDTPGELPYLWGAAGVKGSLALERPVVLRRSVVGWDWPGAGGRREAGGQLS